MFPCLYHETRDAAVQDIVYDTNMCMILCSFWYNYFNEFTNGFVEIVLLWSYD